jgi:hypothetical protein
VTHRHRLRTLERRLAPPDVGRLVIVTPDTWPAAAEAAYRAAWEAGDRETRDTIIEAQTGERPGTGPGITIIEIATRDDGPQ